MTVDAAGTLLPAYRHIDAAWDRLAEYLGPRFQPQLTDYRQCCTFVENEFARYGPDSFYRHSQGYLYDLTHFHFMPYKNAFFEMVTDFADAHGLMDLADVGCGVGLDAQALMAAGYATTLYDFACPSRAYAAWRLERDVGVRGLTRPLGALGQMRHDLVYAVDVLEHIADPVPLVGQMFSAAEHVAVNLFAHDSRPWDGVDMHYPLDHWSLLPLFGRYGHLMQVAINGETVCTLWRRVRGALR